MASQPSEAEVSAMIAVARLMIAPTDRSMRPAKSTIASPSATSPIGSSRDDRLVRLESLRKFGDM